MHVYVHNIYIHIIYVINIERDRELIGNQLCIMTYTCFPHIQTLSTLKNCCYITDQKSMHLAQHLNASINSVSCQAGKENKTGLGQGIFLLHCLFKKYISSWMQTNRIPAVSFIQFLFHSFFILALNSWQINCNLFLVKFLKSSVWHVVVIYFSVAWNIHLS